uniref:Very-long-chain (3R)-3-hydroxyacyl-CoA dehydratase n=1 Tax=Ixodes ricinus TaxID=34613 RepID=V5HPA3_IXORI
MASGTLSPFVYWAQNDSKIFLRVDLRNVKVPSIEATTHNLSFCAYGVGARGEEKYSFTLDFYAPVDPDDCEYRVNDRQVDVHVRKATADYWPRVLAEAARKPAWLKIDFDKLQTEDDDDDSEEDNSLRNFYEEKLGSVDRPPSSWRARRRLQRRTEEFRRVYLFLYNLFQFVGFLYIFLVMLIRYSRDGDRSMEGTWEAVGKAMRLVILLQGLEILHPLLGYTGGSALHPFVLVGGRMLMVFVMIDAEPRMHTKPAVFALFGTYALVELFRYPYYMLRTYNKSIGFITWLRYTVWIPLLPLGFLCEGTIILRNIPYFEETGRFSVALPNAFNFSFHLPSFLRLYLLIGIFPTLAFMMSHMYRQRKKMLGPKDKED